MNTQLTNTRLFFLMTVFLATNFIYSQSIVRGPYLQQGGPTSIIIKWRTSSAETSVVRYGLSQNNLSLQANDNTRKTEHEIKITGLNPKTKYYYQIGSHTPKSNQYFKTAPNFGEETAFRTWILGDPGTKNFRQRKVRDGFLNYSNSASPDIMLLLGDNAYNDGNDDEYQEALFENMYEDILVNTHLWSSTGNHDLLYGFSHIFYNIFSFPTKAELGGVASGKEGYYSFDYANTHFVTIESSRESKDANDEMGKWLKNDLAKNQQDWVVVYFHHPIYSGGHDSDEESDLIELRENYVPIFDQYGVDLVLYGHSHRYERTALIKGHTGLSNTWNSNVMAIDNGMGQINNGGAYDKTSSNSGTVYVTTGNAGKGLGDDGAKPVHKFSNGKIGSGVLEINGKRLDYKQLDEDGNVIDHFTMLKGDVSNDPTCTDGIQNGNETGIDCGGSCDPCQTILTYCKDQSTRTSGEYISKVVLGTINNSTTRSANGYGDHTSISTNLVKDSSTTNTITITPNWAGAGPYNEAYGVWIDYNQDGDFNDSGERVFSKTPSKDTSVSGTFSVPSSAKTGKTRMRIIMEYFNNSTSIPQICKADHNYGETEDYTVNITDQTATCTDGIQNGNETGVDCGGSCDPCQTSGDYCSASGNNGPEGIVNVVFAGINKTSTRNANGYDDFTSSSANVSAGTSHNLQVTIEGYRDGANDEIYAWFDWNQDGDFADSGEFYTLTKTSGLVGNLSINIPQTAKNGTTRMRVLVSYYNSENNPCNTGTDDVRYGEYEDYSVVISGGSKSNNILSFNASAYPNPFFDRITVDASGIGSNFTVSMYDLSGKKVRHQNGDQKSEIVTMDTGELLSGIYFVKIQSKDSNQVIRVLKK